MCSKFCTTQPLGKRISQTKGSAKQLMNKNFFGWTPFSSAVAWGNSNLVDEMLNGLSLAERKAVINQSDFKNVCPLHIAAKYGHADIFQSLLRNGADIERRGPQDMTALQIAIEKGKEDIVEVMLNQASWTAAFQAPTTTSKDDRDNTFRMLIRKFPHLAEKLLDKCYEIKEDTNNAGELKDVVEMNFEFLDDTGINKKHPLIIMHEQHKLDLLQHPVCLALILKNWWPIGFFLYYTNMVVYFCYLGYLTIFVLGSSSPVENAWLFNCSDYFGTVKPPPAELNQTLEEWVMEHTGDTQTVGLDYFVIFATCLSLLCRILLSDKQEYNWILPWVQQVKEIRRHGVFDFIQSIKLALRSLCFALPWVFLFDILLFVTSIYIAVHNYSDVEIEGKIFRVDVISCGQWQVTAITITLAWLKLLVHMRLFPLIGKYIILFKEVISIFWRPTVVVAFIVIGFSLGFHLLLTNQEPFSGDTTFIKTMLMMLGEYEFGDTFLDQKTLPFPATTYAIFASFFAFVSILSLNVLVGVTVDDIRRFLENANVMLLSKQVEFLQKSAVLAWKKWGKGTTQKKMTVWKPDYQSTNPDLVTEEKIWENIIMREKEKAKSD